jgi:hypothetical protein
MKNTSIISSSLAGLLGWLFIMVNCWMVSNAVHSYKFLAKHNVMAVEFTSYSPDLSLLYFYLFLGHRTVLKGQCSRKPRELQQKLQDHLQRY